MARLTILALAASSATLVSAAGTTTTKVSSAASSVSSAQGAGSSVVSIYFPGADPLPYVASLIGQNNGAQTLAISCAPGVNSATCGFPSSVTVTAGPSTAYVSVSNGEATFIYDCKISASTTAVCAETFNGNVAYIMTSTAGSPASTSTVTTETLGSTDITWMPVTITAGLGAKQTASTMVPGTSPNGGSGSGNWTNVNWSNMNSGGSGASNSASVPGMGSASTATGTGVAGTATTPAANTKTGTWPATWTGAAGRNSVVGGYVAGVVAVIGMIL